MTQPSLFSADLIDPEIDDLGGLLAAHGQVAVGAAGARLSILVAQEHRGRALVAECAARGIGAEIREADAAGRDAEGGGGDGADGGDGEYAGRDDGTRAAWLLRTERTTELFGLAAAWTRGAVKATPDGLVISEGMVRLWVLAAGRRAASGYLLGLDPHAPDTYQPLAGALSRIGLAAAVIGAVSPTPALRLTGRNRVARLAEMIGSPPPGCAATTWPDPDR